MGKKPNDDNDDNDLMADFFGDDDLDWLDENEATPQAAAPSSETPPASSDTAAASPTNGLGAAEPVETTLPVAPPPPPAFKPDPATPTSAEPVKLSPRSAEPRRAEPAPVEPAQAEPAPFDGPVPPVPGDDFVLDDDPAPVETPAGTDTWNDDAEPVANETLTPPSLDEPVVVEVEIDDILPVEPPAPQVDDSQLDESIADDSADDDGMVTGDQLEASGQTPAPMVRTQDPAPSRTNTREAGDLSAYTGPDDGDLTHAAGWEGACARLVEEASADIEHRGALLFHAGRVSLRRLGDSQRALALLDDAGKAGFEQTSLHRERATAAMAAEQWSIAESAHAAVGACEEPVASSEAWQEAAGAAAQQDDGEAVIQHLRYAVQACPTDVIALSLLRDQLYPLAQSDSDAAQERVLVTEALAVLCPGPAAAELWWHQAQEARDFDAAVRTALQRVLEQEPDHTAAVIRLRNLLIAAADHSAYSDLLARCAERTEGSDAAWWLARSASAALVAGDTDSALSRGHDAIRQSALTAPRWLAALQDVGEDAAIHAVLGEVLSPDGDETDTQRAFRMVRVALSAERNGDPDAAMQAWTALAAHDSGNALAHAGVARVSSSTDPVDPVAMLSTELESESDTERAAVRAFILGTALERAGRTDEAHAAYTRAGTLPGAWWARYRTTDSPGRLALIDSRVAAISAPEQAASFHLLRALGAPPVDQDGRPSLVAARAGRPQDPVIVGLIAGALAQNTEDAEWLSSLRAEVQNATDAAGEDTARIALLSAHATLGQSDYDAAEALRHVAARAFFVERAAPEADPADALAAVISAGRAACDDETQQRWWDVASAHLATASGQDDAVDQWLALSADDDLRASVLSGAIQAALVSPDVAARLDALAQVRGAATSDAEQAAVLVHEVEELAALGNRDAFSERVAELLALAGVDAPWRALALSAESLGEWRSAVDLLERAGGTRARLDWARLVGGALADPASGLRLFRTLDEPEVREAAAVRALNVSRAVDDIDAMAAAHGVLSEGDDFDAFRAAHAGWAADAYEELGDNDRALRFHTRALALRPTSQTAFYGARRLTIHAQDGVALKALYAEHEGDPLLLAEDLEAIGDEPEALSVWTDLATSLEPVLPSLLAMEQLYRKESNWPEVASTLKAERAAAHSEHVQDAVSHVLLEVLTTHLPDSDDTFEAYGAMAAANPSDRELAARYAKMAGVRGETSQAIQTLTRLVETADNAEESATTLVLLGDLLRETDDADGARQSYLDALDHMPGQADALAGLRGLAEDAGDVEAAIAVMQRELATVPQAERADALLRIAEVTAGQDDVDPTIAMDAWRAALDADDTNTQAARALLTLAQEHDDAATLDRAGEALLASVSGTERAELLRMLGDSALNAGDRDRAVTCFEQAVAMSPPDLIAAAQLEPLYEAARNWSGLRRLLMMQVEAGEPDAAADRLARAAGIALDREGDVEGAERLYADLLERDPDHMAALSFQANRAYRERDFARASELFGRLGDRLIGDRDLDDFDDRLEASLLYHRYGVALMESGQPDAAREVFERALELDETHLPSLERVAPLYRAAGDFDRASDVYRRMLQLARGQGDKARMATLYVELGLVDHACKEDERAAKRFGKALELDSFHAPALLGMALIYEEQEEYDNCWKSYNAVIQNATNPEGVILAYLRKGRVLDERKHRLDKSAEHYERCLKFEPGQPAAQLRLAEILTRLDRTDDAIFIIERGLANEAMPTQMVADLHVVRALIHQDAGEADAARAELHAARDAYPPISDALGDAPLDDLDALRDGLRRRLPVL